MADVVEDNETLRTLPPPVDGAAGAGRGVRSARLRPWWRSADQLFTCSERACVVPPGQCVLAELRAHQRGSAAGMHLDPRRATLSFYYPRFPRSCGRNRAAASTVHAPALGGSNTTANSASNLKYNALETPTVSSPSSARARRAATWASAGSRAKSSTRARACTVVSLSYVEVLQSLLSSLEQVTTASWRKKAGRPQRAAGGH